MERIKLQKHDAIAPDRINVIGWRYVFNITSRRFVTFSFDGEKVYKSKSVIHGWAHDVLKTDDLLDFRYYPSENILSVWIYDSSLIVKQLKLFEKVYRESDWKPFDIDTVYLLFSSDGYAVKCLFRELDQIDKIDENYKLREFHIMPPSLKNLVIDKDMKREYYKEGERSWIMKHGSIDPAYYHLLVYEE